MPDEVKVLIGNKEIAHFISYQVGSDLFEAADSFSLELANPNFGNLEKEIQAGLQCQLYVNKVLELTGIVDRVSETYSKSSHTITVEGRDLMGLIVDSYVENEFKTKENASIQDLAEELLKSVPFIDRSKIIYGTGSKDRAVPVREEKETLLSEKKDFIQIEPGRTVFEALKEYALAAGLLFFNLPDGTFVFGEPVTRGRAIFNLVCRIDGRGNNVLECTRTRDISQQYSKVRVIGQQQDSVFGVGDVNKSGEALNEDFPFAKPYVLESESVSAKPENQAKLIMNKQNFEGFTLECKVKGHSQRGRNLQTNTIAHLKHEGLKPPVDKDYLVYARTFERSKQDGTTTTLRLSELGILPA